MKKNVLILSALVLVVAAAVISCENSQAKTEVSAGISKDSLIKRGEYLVTISGCEDCHTPKKMGPMGPEPDMDKRLSGYRSEVPFPTVDTNIIK